MQDADDLANGMVKQLKTRWEKVLSSLLKGSVFVSYDEEVKAYYIYMTRKKIAKTISPIEGICNIDLDKDGQVIGIEIFEK